MIGRPSGQSRRHWIHATAISLALHGAAIAAIFHDPFSRRAAESAAAPAEIAVETLTLPAGGDAGEDAKTAQPVPPGRAPSPEAAAAAPSADAAPAILTGTQSWQVLARPLPELPARTENATDIPDTAPGERGTDRDLAAPAPDPRLAALIDDIRSRLDIPCLLMLPQLLADDSLQLSVLGADDRQILRVISDMAAGDGAGIPDRRILLDRHQCPGLTFARQVPDYPVLGLSIRLQSGDISSGEALRGQIVNGAGHHNTLLLVDDNGVVHDLRRFLIAQGGEIGFDVPMARAGAPRDTHQLLIAIATRDRIASASSHAGRLASDFFPALLAELGEDVLIGIGSVYLR